MRKSVSTLTCVVVGNTVLAVAVAAFVLPNGLISGGVTGIALMLEHWFGLSVELGVAVANVGLFMAGALVLGKKFALTTLLSTILYPALLSFFNRIPLLQNLTHDTLMAAIYAGVLEGIGIGLVLRVGASTGGMDIPPLILNKKLGLSIAGTMYALDFIILLFQFFFASSEQVLYGIITVFLMSFVIDRVLLLGKSQTQVLIVSARHEAINQAVQEKLDRGTTLLNATTGRLKEDRPVVMTVVANRQLAELNQLVTEIDQEAFFIVTPVNEVKGRGFSLGKQYQRI